MGAVVIWDELTEEGGSGGGNPGWTCAKSGEYPVRLDGFGNAGLLDTTGDEKVKLERRLGMVAGILQHP